MYVQGFVLPVPATKKEQYRAFSERTAAAMTEHGLIENVQAWEADVPDGEHTDFRKAVKLEDGEQVVFTWLAWPDRATCDAAHEKMAADPRTREFHEEIPFDGKRMIHGGFDPIVQFGRQADNQDGRSLKMYIQGFLVPVPEDKKEDYRRVAQMFAEMMQEFGLIEDVEAWEADVPDGEHTDFRKAVKLEPGEKVVFSWLIWPDKETCDAAHEKMMADPRMKEFGDQMPFDGKRMIYGGFEPIVNWRK